MKNTLDKFALELYFLLRDILSIGGDHAADWRKPEISGE